MMTNTTPTYDVKETAKNAREFVKQNKGVVWNVFKPFIIFFLLLTLFDIVAPQALLPASYAGLQIGSIISVYFMAILIISYYRLIIKGAERFEPAKMFQPTESELSFVVMIFIFFAVFSVSAALIGSIFSSASIITQYGIGAFLIVVQIFILYRASFYFVASAINEPITLKGSMHKTKGLVLKMVLSFVLASWRVLALIILCFVLISFTVFALQEIGFEQQKTDVLMFVLVFPMMIYFMPVLMALNSYVVSSYYEYVQQGAEQDIT